MVKQIFVFSDMRFDDTGADGPWANSCERVKMDFEKAGYKMPRLIFWNLSGGCEGTALKPTTAQEHGLTLVSGYSQDQLKMFLEKEQLENEEDILAEKNEEGGRHGVVERKEPKMDPLSIIKQIVSHKAYDMLKVVD